MSTKNLIDGYWELFNQKYNNLKLYTKPEYKYKI